MTQQKFLSVLRGKKAPRPPVWLMRQAGRYLPEYKKTRKAAGSFLDLCYNSRLASEVTLQPIKKFDFDAAILFADILLICDSLGQKINYLENKGPVLEPIKGREEIKKLEGCIGSNKLDPVYETVRRTREGLDEKKSLIGFAGAPWTVAAYMVEGGGSKDFAAAQKMAQEDPDGFSFLINIITSATINYLEKQIAAGVDAIQIFDSWAGVLSERGFNEWCIKPTQKIVKKIKRKYPGIPIIGFPRQAGALISRYVDQTGVDCVGLDSGVSIKTAITLQKRCVVQGNLDPSVLLRGGPFLDNETRRILTGLGNGPHIFNLGHGVLPNTPPENVARLMKTIKEFKL